MVQMAPSLWSAYRTRHPAGISRGTWLLILAELTCWGLYGIRSSDPRLITLGSLGVIASALMLMRSGSTAPDRALALSRNSKPLSTASLPCLPEMVRSRPNKGKPDS